MTIFAHHNFSWVLDIDYDVEGDDAIFTATIMSATNVSIAPTWFSVTNNDVAQISFEVDDPVQPLVGTNFT